MREITYLEAVREAMTQEMERDERVFLIGEDIGEYGGAFQVSYGMLEQFGHERILDTPITELGLTGAAVGAALIGMRPIAEIMFMDFTTLASDQLVNQAAKIRFMFGGNATIPMVLRTPAGSGSGAASQHSQSLENWFVHIPGLKVVMPTTPYDVKGLLTASIRDDNPVVFIESKQLYKTKGEVPEEQYVIPLGKADIKREGTDMTIIATGIMVSRSLEAAETLAQEGISIEVVDPRTLRPLDTETIIQSVKKTGKVLIVHEAVKTGGFGGELAAVIAESEAFGYLDAPIQRLAGLDIPIPYNPTLEYHSVPHTENIIESARNLAQLRV
jgi:acetoin:2,6-dichlorophenolindophenol oxidoreductase subunit beta